MVQITETLESALSGFIVAAKLNTQAGPQMLADAIARARYDGRYEMDETASLVEQRLAVAFKKMTGRDVRVDDMSVEGQRKWRASQPFNYGS